MATAAQPYDLEGDSSYFPITGGPTSASPTAEQRLSKRLFASILFSSFLLLSVILLIGQPNSTKPSTSIDFRSPIRQPPSRGVAQGVSEKGFRRVGGGGGGVQFSWNNAMLSWQRTSFHFQPEKNWMNGNCHLFQFMFNYNMPLIYLCTSFVNFDESSIK